MAEFTGRWLFAGLACAGVFAVTGVSVGGPLGLVLVILWMGFWNALLRPLVLRLGVKGTPVLWLLLVALALLNTFLFISASTCLPVSGKLDPCPLAVAVLVATSLTWAASARFRTHDGHWHWITYHGSMLKVP